MFLLSAPVMPISSFIAMCASSDYYQNMYYHLFCRPLYMMTVFARDVPVRLRFGIVIITRSAHAKPRTSKRRHRPLLSSPSLRLRTAQNLLRIQFSPPVVFTYLKSLTEKVVSCKRICGVVFASQLIFIPQHTRIAISLALTSGRCLSQTRDNVSR